MTTTTGMSTATNRFFVFIRTRLGSLCASLAKNGLREGLLDAMVDRLPYWAYSSSTLSTALDRLEGGCHFHRY